MLLAFMPITRDGETRLRLCFTPDKPDVLSVPVLVDDLFPTNCAVVRIGAEESLVVSTDVRENSLLFNGIEPSSIYLTPNVAQNPGFKTKYLRIERHNQETYKVYHSRDKSKWEDWVPNRERA